MADIRITLGPIPEATEQDFARWLDRVSVSVEAAYPGRVVLVEAGSETRVCADDSDEEEVINRVVEDAWNEWCHGGAR